MAEFQTKRRTVVEARVDGRLPGDDTVEIAGANLERLVGRVVHVGVELQIVDLGAEVELALADKETAGHPVNVRVLEEARGQRPLRRPRGEPDHFLTAVNAVDDGSNGALVDGPSRLKHGESSGGVGVGDGAGVMVQADEVDRLVNLEAGAREERVISQADARDDIAITASRSIGVEGRSAKLGPGVLVDADHADVEAGLVRKDLVPLGIGQGALVGAIVVVGDAADEDDRAVVGVGGSRVEDGQVGASLRDRSGRPGDSVGLEAGADAGDIVVVAGDEEDGGRGGDGGSGEGGEGEGSICCDGAAGEAHCLLLQW